MEFASLHFLLFLIALLLLIRSGLLSHTHKKVFLLIASYYFYACWDWEFTGLLFFATCVSYWSGLRLASSKSLPERRLVVCVQIAVVLGVLLYFKYANFFIENFSYLTGLLGWKLDISLLEIVLPIGISFFTFQCISYGVDVYRGRILACRRPLDFALYIAFFPTILSGPITRASDLLPQFGVEQQRRTDEDMQGMALLLRGFAKKIVFADTLGGQLVSPAFQTPSAYSSLFLFIAVYAYSFQIYMDLSGYTDIARGIAATFGYRLPINFNRPYLATSVSNFWQRWHISMSSFFRDYLYFSIGGSKYGNAYVNLVITFIFIGFWHGASWGFMLYGCVHGLCVAWERWVRVRRERLGVPIQTSTKLACIARIFLVFNIIAFSRVLFRAGDFGAALHFFNSLLRFEGGESPWRGASLMLLLLAVIFHYIPQDWTDGLLNRFARIPLLLQAATLTFSAVMLGIVGGEGAPFIYFQF